MYLYVIVDILKLGRGPLLQHLHRGKKFVGDIYYAPALTRLWSSLVVVLLSGVVCKYSDCST